jgi:hypothetical protein
MMGSSNSQIKYKIEYGLSSMRARRMGDPKLFLANGELVADSTVTLYEWLGE